MSQSLISASPLYPTKNDSRQLEWGGVEGTDVVKILALSRSAGPFPNARLSGENKKGNIWIALQKRKLELVGVGKLIIDHSPAAGSRRWIIIPPTPKPETPINVLLVGSVR